MMRSVFRIFVITYAVIVVCLVGLLLAIQQYILLYWTILLLGVSPFIVYAFAKTVGRTGRVSHALEAHDGKWYAGITVLPEWVEPFLQSIFRSYIGNLVGTNNYLARDGSWLFLQLNTGYFRSVDENTRTTIEPRTNYTVFARKLSRSYVDMYFDNRHNVSHILASDKKIIRTHHLIQCEGVFMKNFKVYGQRDQAVEILSIASPELLQAITECAAGADIYVHEDQLIFLYDTIVDDAPTVERAFENSIRLAAELEDNAPRRGREINVS